MVSKKHGNNASEVPEMRHASQNAWMSSVIDNKVNLVNIGLPDIRLQRRTAATTKTKVFISGFEPLRYDPAEFEHYCHR